MLIIISPSKGQDFDTEYPHSIHSTPDMLTQSQILIDCLKKLNTSEIQKLMSVSENIATLNEKRYQNFHTPFIPANAKTALFAFTGDVYSGFSKNEFTDADCKYAQNHLRILSGLYGALRPMDLIQPYRLEMKTKLKTPKGEDLYQFWDEQITKQLNDALTNHDEKILLNLASNEYFKSIKPKSFNGQIVTIHFKEIKEDKCRVIAIYAKKARGLMADFIIRNQIETISDIQAFNSANYRFDSAQSDDANLIFTRLQPKAKN